MKLLRDDTANVKMVGGVVAILVTIIIAVLVFYNIAASVDLGDVDDDLNASHPDVFTYGSGDAANASIDVMDQSATFFTIAPIIAIVVVAVVILGYVSRIG